MSRKVENAGFTCINCGRRVLPLSSGSFRNHCPFCLFSRHMDVVPGDRKQQCGGLMEPVGLRYRPGKGFQIVHRCLQCGEERINKIAEDPVQPDDIEALVRLSRLPVN